MRKKYRYTGEWPPLHVLNEFPNWEYALDEEGIEGQDETTIRPELEQNHITRNTVFTAGKVTQADGSAREAILTLINGDIDAVDIFINETDCWRVYRTPSGWQPFEEDWLPENQRMPVVLLTDSSVFPLHVRSVLTMGGTGKPLEIVIRA
jgi:hypothetical protein